jgi:hypothetical protein
MQSVIKKPYAKPELFCIVDQNQTAAGKASVNAAEAATGTCKKVGAVLANVNTRVACATQSGSYHANVSHGTAS